MAIGLLFACLCVLALIAALRREKAGQVRQGLNTPTAQRDAHLALSSATPTTAELVQRLRSIDWFQFERLVAHACRKLGYAVEVRGGANPDGGIDLVISKEGKSKAVQCKHWKTWSVGVKSVREFLGAMTDGGYQEGIFLTLCGYTEDAHRLAEKHGIEMIDEKGFPQILEATDARFDPEALELLNGLRKVCPKCERELVLRTAMAGRGAGDQFWGCSGFPECRFTMPFEPASTRGDVAGPKS